MFSSNKKINLSLSKHTVNNVLIDRLLMLFVILGVATIILFLMNNISFASDAQSGGGTSLPWEGPLQTLRKSVSGPVAFGVSLLGLVSGGCMLIFGGEISEFIKRIIYLVLVISIIVFANSIMTSALFSGAVIPEHFLKSCAGCINGK